MSKHFFILIITFYLSACSGSEPAVTLGDQRFVVEIADDSAEITQGLMFRTEMADNHGMIFLFPNEQPRSFWMKNTRIPLDIFYFDSDLKLVSVAENAKPCRTARCRSYPSSGPAQYVLELNGGMAEQLGVAAGAELILHNVR